MNNDLKAMENVNMAMVIRSEELNEILQSVGAPFRVQYTQKFKPNGMRDAYVLDGCESADTKCSPIVYMGDWWNLSNQELVNVLIDIYKNTTFEKSVGLLIKDREYVLAHMHAKVMSLDNLSNIKSSDMVAIPYLDMLITFYIVLSDDLDRQQTVNLNAYLLDALELNIEEVMDAAMKNLHKEVRMATMAEMLGVLVDDEFGIDIPEMYILTNTSGLFGASCLISSDLIQNMENKIGKKVYLIPSSLHEIIAVPESITNDVEELLAMVKEVNRSGIVGPEDILTNSVYRLIDGDIQICK